jgi:tetratricopeptide (TPR) repeat protein
MAAGKMAVLKALELDDTLAEAHVQLAANAYYGEWNWSATERALARALGLNPNLSVGYQVRADLLLMNRRRAEAAAALDRCLELDPLNPWTQTAVGGRYLRIDRDEEGSHCWKGRFAPIQTWRSHISTWRPRFTSAARTPTPLSSRERFCH